jgi:hypothetical protein
MSLSATSPTGTFRPCTGKESDFMHRITLVVVALALALVALGCKSEGDGEGNQPSKLVEDEPRTVPGQVARDFAETRDRVLERMNARLIELDTKIASLERDLASRAAERKAEASDALTEQLADLERKRTEAREALEQARTATEERWEQLERKTDDTLNRARDAYEEVVRELRK